MSLITAWNPRQAALKEALNIPAQFDEAIRLCLALHGNVHTAAVSEIQSPTILDELLNGLSDEMFRILPKIIDCFRRKASIAWNIWHITRIEDITMNILVTDDGQIFNDDWLKKLKSTVNHTGNGMTEDEIAVFSQNINIDALLSYRNAVGIHTRKIIQRLTPPDLKRKMNPESVRRILSEGGVTEHKDSVWLLDYWGKKTVAGILLMPITRHQIMHINDSMQLKEKIMKITSKEM